MLFSLGEDIISWLYNILTSDMHKKSANWGNQRLAWALINTKYPNFS